MAKNKPLKDEEYDSIDEIQTTLDRHTDKLNRIEAGLVSIKSEIASVSKTGALLHCQRTRTSNILRLSLT